MKHPSLLATGAFALTYVGVTSLCLYLETANADPHGTARLSAILSAPHPAHDTDNDPAPTAAQLAISTSTTSTTALVHVPSQTSYMPDMNGDKLIERFDFAAWGVERPWRST